MSFLQLTVAEAENLVAGDDDGWSDPYCVIGIGSQRKKTKVIRKSLNPRWNETFSFTIQSRDKFLLVEVWDWDAVGRDDFLGQVQISVEDLENGYFEIKKYSLVGKKENSVDRGSIYLRGRVVSKAAGKLGGQQLSMVKQRIVESLENNRQDLSLEGCGLSSCPTLLAEKLSALTALDLSFNQFSQWPELSPLIHLQQLSLNGNLLVNISPSIAFLTSLIELSLTGNQLSSLPPEIGRLPCLENLGAANNQILSLCPEIGRLYKLEQLDLSGNPIQKLPPHVGGLRGLEILNLSGCELMELPEEFSLMTRLIELNLSNNQLKSLPEGVGRMTRLTVLNLMFNQLPDLPITLGFCVGLARLGSGITIANNPIENPDMWRKYQIGTDHLFDYLEKRLSMFGEANIEFPEVSLPPDLLQWEASARNAKLNSSSPQVQRQNQQQLPNQQQPQAPYQQHQNQQQQYQQQQYQQQQSHQQQSPQMRRQQPVDVAEDLTTKIVVLKNWAISAIRGDLKPKMVKLGNFVGRTTDARAVTQTTTFAEHMKPEVEKAKRYLPAPPPTRLASPTGGDKLFVAKYAVGVVVDEINYMLGVFFGILQQTTEIAQILGIVGFLKEVKRELSYLEINYQ